MLRCSRRLPWSLPPYAFRPRRRLARAWQPSHRSRRARIRATPPKADERRERPARSTRSSLSAVGAPCLLDHPINATISDSANVAAFGSPFRRPRVSEWPPPRSVDFSRKPAQDLPYSAPSTLHVREERPELASRKLPNFDRDSRSGLALGRAHKPGFGRRRRQHEQPVAGRGSDLSDETRAELGELVVLRLAGEVRPDEPIAICRCRDCGSIAKVNPTSSRCAP